MIVENIIGNIKEIKTEKTEISVEFDWFELEKRRIKKTASDGMEFGLALASPLSEGDILAETENCVYVVRVLPTELLKVQVHSMKEMGRACFELGNRHLSPRIGEDFVEVVYDEPTFQYMKKLGFEAAKVTERFTDFIVCKAHGHDHDHHDHAGEHHHG